MGQVREQLNSDRFQRGPGRHHRPVALREATGLRAVLVLVDLKRIMMLNDVDTILCGSWSTDKQQ
jgi:hypothetical protein